MDMSSAVMTTLLVAGVTVGAAVPRSLTPHIVQTRFATVDIVIAVRSLAPVAGETDASTRIQTEIDRIAAAGGGVLFLAEGLYPLRRPLLVRESVTVRGDWAPPATGVEGTILAVYDRRGNTDGPAALTLQRGSGCRELSIWYPEQTPTDVVPYPWTMGTTDQVGGDNVTIMNVTLVNPFRGIRVGPEWNELHTLRNVFMTPLKTGFATDTTTDIGRLNRLVMGPGVWEESGLPGAPATATSRQTLRRHLATNVLGVDIGRSDWEYIYAVQIEGLATGIRFRTGVRGTANAVMLECNFADCGVAIRLENLNGIGLSATACSFEGSEVALEAVASFSTVAQFNTCSFTGSDEVVRLAGRGLLSFQNCRFSGTVLAQQGKVSVLDCEFSRDGPHVTLREGVVRARILGCRFSGNPVIEVAADNADLAISHAPLGSARLAYSPRVPAPIRTPGSRQLFSVTEAGASPDNADNSAAFTAALTRAGDSGGGTVYVPAGLYRFEQGFTVPAGVELRGCFDVPHHTISAGSVLMPVGGRGEEEGTPFMHLQPGSGLRGLTVWYPEQDMGVPVAYPWAVRSLGPGCWLEDVTLGNAWQGVDFWTHSSDGHVIRYLAGACFRRGLAVSKCAGKGWVEDVQFNPHYSLRLHASLPHPPMSGPTGGKVINFQREHLDAMVFGRCDDEQIFATFLYAAYDGLACRDDGGGTQGRVLIHGTDTASRALVLEAAGPRGIDFVNAQLVSLGKWVKSAIVTAPGFSGEARLFNSQIWAGPSTGQLHGGTLLLQQANTLSGPITVDGGTVRLENVTFGADLSPHVVINRPVTGVDLTGCMSASGVFRWQAADTSRVRAFASSASLIPVFDAGLEGARTYACGFEAAGPPILENTLADTGGGRRGVAEASCRIVDCADAPDGKRALELAGRIADRSYSHCYFRIADGPFVILPDTVLRYRLKPLNEGGRHVAIDAVLSEGAPLRDRGISSTSGVPAHPSPPKGAVGEWQLLEYPLGRLAGMTIQYLMAAFDTRNLEGEFAALFDGVEVHSDMGASNWHVMASPKGGRLEAGTRVTLKAGTASIRYTLDGSNPSLDSPLYGGPVALPAGKTTEIRFAAQTAADKTSPIVFSEIYEAP